MRSSLARPLALGLLLLGACHPPSLVPAPVDGPVLALDGANPNGNDDDPAVAVDAQGTIHVVYISDRDQTNNLYSVHSTGFDVASGAIAWSAPLRITNNDPVQFPLSPSPAKGDFFPSLFIDDAGTHHLAWFRQNLANETHILYAKSDGTATGWATAAVVDVTSGPNGDRFPYVVKFATNDLRVYFSSTTRKTSGKDDIFMSQSADNGATWSAPAEVALLNSAGEQSSFPHVVKLASDWFIATFARWKLGIVNGFFDPSADVFYAQSGDGTTWSVEQITSDPSDSNNDLAPAFFFDHSGSAHIAWSTNATGDPFEDVVEMAVADRAAYPASVKPLSPAFGIADHSPQLVAVRMDGRAVFVMVWVRIANPPYNQLVYRVFSNL